MPPLVGGNVPVTPVVSGSPVALVKTSAEGVPSAGVTNVGDVAKTADPVPVSSVMADLRFALDGVAKAVATPVPNPETPVLIGSPVQLVKTPLDGVPSAGVTNVGDVAKTADPVPVSSVIADLRFALDGVARAVATPVPSPDTPVEIGSPVAFVSVAAEGVPKFGVTNVGDVASTTVLPLPVVVPATIAFPTPAKTGDVTVIAKSIAGVVLGFVTVKLKPLPSFADTPDTVPPPDNPSQLLTAPSVVTKAVSPCSALIFAPPQIVGWAATPNESRAKKIIMMFFMRVSCAYRLSTNQTPVPPE